MASPLKRLVNLFKRPPAFLRDIHQRNHELFRYVYNGKLTCAPFVVHKTAYLNYGPYAGDCTDFAMTVAHLVLEANHPSVRKVTWKYCRLSDNSVHVVVGVEMLNGDIWVSDSLRKSLKLIGDITGYEWVYYKDAAKLAATAKVL